MSSTMMADAAEPLIPSHNVLQVRVTLDTVPGYAKVRRRLLLPPGLDLAQTHAVLQQALGWSAKHLYAFVDPRNGVLYTPEPEQYQHRGTMDAEGMPLGALLKSPGRQLLYVYNLSGGGSAWRHTIELEAVTSGSHVVQEGCYGPRGWAFVEEVLTGKRSMEELLMDPEDLFEWLQDSSSQLLMGLPTSRESTVTHPQTASEPQWSIPIAPEAFDFFDLQDANKHISSMFDALDEAVGQALTQAPFSTGMLRQMFSRPTAAPLLPFHLGSLGSLATVQPAGLLSAAATNALASAVMPSIWFPESEVLSDEDLAHQNAPAGQA